MNLELHRQNTSKNALNKIGVKFSKVGGENCQFIAFLPI